MAEPLCAPGATMHVKDVQGHPEDTAGLQGEVSGLTLEKFPVSVWLCEWS